jgi:superfamily II DNA or RNA helicase
MRNEPRARSSGAAQRRLELVRAYVARSVLPPLPPPTLGEVILAPHQREAAARLLAIMARHGGALLADDVGLGKTYVALAVAREYERCTVIAPPALLPMWSGAVRRTHTRHAELRSLHAFSRGEPVALVTRARHLVIIDEAHHLRNPATVRYARVSAATAGADMLLMTATPVHNREDDVRALLALFAGSRPDLLDADRRAELIVRREASAVRGDASSMAGSRPTVRWHHAHRVPMNRAILERIMALPAPLPANGGAEAGALIRMGLLRAWCSSEAALADAVRRRRLRGAVLRDALEVGRHPTQAELRSWALSEGEVQLGFAELLAAGPVEHGPLLAVLDRHLEALAALADALRSAGSDGAPSGDTARAQYLRAVMAQHPGVPVVAFSQYARTVEAMYRALSDIAGVGMLTGNRARIASGPIAREEALQRFAPRAHERPPPPPHQAIRVLLTTDILAEGVNLQDAGVVVHCDAPWTAALRDQRVGRCARIGSPWGHVHVYRLAPSEAIERVVRWEARVVRKAAIGARVVGRAGRARSVVEGRSALVARLAAWMRDGEDRSPNVAVQRVDALPLRRGARVRVAALVACERERGGVLAVWRAAERWVVSARVSTALALVEAASVREPVAARVARSVVAAWCTELARAVRRWRAHQRARAVAGREPESLSDVQRAALSRLAWAAGRVSVSERARLAPVLAAAQRTIESARTPVAERALRAWLDLPKEPVASWLSVAPRSVEPVAVDGAARDEAGRLRILLLVAPRTE